MSVDTAIPAFLDRRPFIGTYTILNAYKNCPHQMSRRYIVRDQPYVETPEMKFGNDVHSAFELRLSAKKPLPDSMRQWEHFAAPFDAHKPICEQKLAITKTGHPTGYWDNNCWFRGKADVTLINGDTAYIPDWKTGNSKFEDPFELATNAMLLHAKFPNLKRIMGAYIWLKENRISQMYDLSDTRATWNQVNKLMGEIVAKRATMAFEKRQSGLCGWCSVKDCEHHRERAR